MSITNEMKLEVERLIKEAIDQNGLDERLVIGHVKSYYKSKGYQLSAEERMFCEHKCASQVDLRKNIVGLKPELA